MEHNESNSGPLIIHELRSIALKCRARAALVVALQRWVKLDHEIVRFKPAWEKVHYIEAEIKGLKGLAGARYNYVPPSGKGCGYHTIGLQLNFDHKTEAEVEILVKSLRRDNPEAWVRYWRGRNSFIINTLNLVDGDEKIIAERIKKVFG